MEKNVLCRVGFVDMSEQYSKIIDIASELKEQEFILNGLQFELADVECDFEDDIDDILDKICPGGILFSTRYYIDDNEKLSDRDKQCISVEDRENLDFKAEKCVVFLIYEHYGKIVIPKAALVFGESDSKILFLILPVRDSNSNDYLNSNEFVKKLKNYEEDIKCATLKDDRIFKLITELKIRKNLAT